MTGDGKRAHLTQELIFQNMQLELVTLLDFVHKSDSVKCYNFCQEAQFFYALKIMHLKAQNELSLIENKIKIDHLSQMGPFPRACHILM